MSSNQRSAREDPFAQPPRAPRTGLQVGWLFEGSGDAKGTPHATTVRDDTRRHLLPALGVTRRMGSRFWRPPHPLENSSLFRSLGNADRRLLRRLFQSQCAAEHWSSVNRARQHLAGLFPFWPIVQWRQIRGPHLFLGATGAGKTTLLFKVARQLTAEGRAVWAVSLGPADRTRQALFAAQAAESGASFAFVRDAQELRRVLARSGPDETILFDTPCLIGHATWLRGALQHPGLRHPHTILHLCHSLQHSLGIQERVLQLAGALHYDFRALAHVDLADGLAPLLALQRRQPRPLSLANAAEGLQSPLLPFETAALLEALADASSD